MYEIPQSHLDLVDGSKKSFAHLATLMSDGSPQVTPVWFSMDGKFFMINTAIGRVKDKNMKARPQVAVCISDPDNPYRYLQIRGKVVASTHEGADEHIDALAHKYLGLSKYPSRRPGEKRIIYRIIPVQIDAHG